MNIIDKYPSVLDEKVISEKNQLLQEKLEKRRNDWTFKIDELIKKSSDFDKTAEVQVLLLSYRHALVDYIAGDLSVGLSKAQTFLEKTRKTVLLETKTNYNYKLSSDKEKGTIMDADSRIPEEMLELLESQMYFCKECIKLLDNLGFSIKNRIDFQKFINGEH